MSRLILNLPDETSTALTMAAAREGRSKQDVVGRAIEAWESILSAKPGEPFTLKEPDGRTIVSLVVLAQPGGAT